MNLLRSFSAKCWPLLAVWAFLFTFSSCDEDTMEEMNNPPVADAGTDVAVEVGESVTLDGSASSDEDGDDLTFRWEILSAPTGSAATIGSSTSAIASFIPDVEGTYEINLTVEDGEVSSTDQVSVVAEIPAAQVIDIAGTISETTVLEDVFPGTDQADYIATGAVNVNAELTIDPGVVIEFSEDVFMTVSTEGALVASGTADDANNKIVLTSDNASSGIRWGGIKVSSTDSRNILNYVEVTFAGSTEIGEFSNFVDVPANIGIFANGRMSITNSTISDGGGYGTYIRFGELVNFENNTYENNELSGIGLPVDQVFAIDENTSFTNNTEHAVEIFGSSLTVNDDTGIVNLANDASYNVSGSLSIENDLIVQAGADFTLDEDVFITIAQGGSMALEGTATDLVTLTSSNIDGEIRWGGIKVNSASSLNRFTYADISYAGSTAIGEFADFIDVPANIGLYGGGRVSLVNTTVSNGGGYGMYIRFGEIIDFESNDFSDNLGTAIGLNINQAFKMDSQTTFSGNGRDAVEVYGSTMSLTNTEGLQDLDGDTEYYFTGSVTLDRQMIVNAGNRLELAENVFITVATDGALTVNGEMDNRVTFTTANLTSGINWGGIKIASSSALNSFNYTDISFAGSTEIGEFADFVDEPASIGVYGDGKVSITNTTIEESGGYGAYVRFGELINFADNSFSNNTLYGLGIPAREINALDNNTSWSGNTEGAVEVFGSTLSDEASTWPALAGGVSYVATGQIAVQDQEITIEPGVNMVFRGDFGMNFTGSSTLIAEGNSSSPIIFDSYNPDAFPWRGILIDNSTSNNSLDFVTIKNGGSSKYDFDSFVDAKVNLGIGTNSQVSITNSTIINRSTDANGYGIYSDGTTNDINNAGNTFDANENNVLN